MLAKLQYRQAPPSDIPAMAEIRAREWGTLDYWTNCIAGYMTGTLHPQHALPPRVAYVALAANTVVGFITGHLTRRFQCEGELDQRGPAAAEE